MKRIWLLFLLLAPALLFAQSAPLGYFQLAGGRVIWQSVYSSGLTADEAARRLMIEGFRVVDTRDGLVSFFCDGLSVSPEDFGFHRGEAPMYVTGSDLAFRGFIQIKDGRYRVTLDRFLLVDNTKTAGGVFIAGTSSPIESQAVNGSEFANGFKKIPARIYNQFLYRLFSLSDPESVNYLSTEW